MTTKGAKTTEKSEAAAEPAVMMAAQAAPLQDPVQVLPPEEIVVPGIPGEKVVYVKTVDGKYRTFPSITAAVKYSVDGAVLKVKKNVKETVKIEGGRTLTIDLEGNEWSSDATPLTVIGADVTVLNGTITATNASAIVVGADNESAEKKVTTRSFVKLKDDDEVDDTSRIDVHATGFNAVELRCGGVLVSQAHIEVSGAAAVQSYTGSFSNTGAACYILGGTVEVTSSGNHVIDWHQGDLIISGGKIIAKDTDAIELDAGTVKMSGGSVDAGSMTAILINQMRPLNLSIDGGVLDGDTGCINETSTVGGKNLWISVTGGYFKTTGTVFTTANAKNFVSGTSFLANKTFADEFIAPKYVLESGTVPDPADPTGELKITGYYLVFNDWVLADGGAVGGGIGDKKRMFLNKAKVKYKTNGISLPLNGFTPEFVIANAKDGIIAWYDKVNKKVVLYTASDAEVADTTVIEDLSLLLIGN